MIVGFDYWQVLSHYPKQVAAMVDAFGLTGEVEVHFISAIGKTRIGTIAGDVWKSLYEGGLEDAVDVIPTSRIHEVVFKKSRESPELKLAKCKELGITMFFDDRQDVCDLLNANGILAFKVPRKGDIVTDTEGERL